MLVTDALVDRIVAIETVNLDSRLRPFTARPGNPAGIHIERFGSATAFVHRTSSVRFYNSVLGAGPGSIEHLDAILDLYARHGTTPAIEIVPGRLTEALGLALAARGFAMVEFHAGLARELTASDASRAFLPVGVEVDELDPHDPRQLDTFLEVYLGGWGSLDDESKINGRLWKGNESWRFYLARVEGSPAGAAILDVRGATAMLASASTLPRIRGHRVQSALLSRRIADAAAVGCDLIVGGAYVGTSSVRNQQRAGLGIAFTRGIWIPTKGVAKPAPVG